MPQMPGQGQIVTPPVHKTHLQCCGYTCAQGTPHPWQCPGCGKVLNAGAPALNADPQGDPPGG